MTNKKHGTDYISDFCLSLIVRTHQLSNGNTWIEPSWLGDDERSGPLLFVSPIDAEIFKLRRNSCQSDDPKETHNWQRISLSKFDLHQHIIDCQGQLECMLAFGFSATLEGKLVAPKGTPRSLYIPLPFTLSKDTPRATFSFNGWAFDFIREQWKIIGAANYANQLDHLNALDDDAITALAKEAVNQVSFAGRGADDSDWGVFVPDSKQWKMGSSTGFTKKVSM